MSFAAASGALQSVRPSAPQLRENASQKLSDGSVNGLATCMRGMMDALNAKVKRRPRSESLPKSWHAYDIALVC